ncbi:MAG: TetR/AcrR family transcriptional regulator [Acidimicrobiales bacterium]
MGPSRSGITAVRSPAAPAKAAADPGDPPAAGNPRSPSPNPSNSRNPGNRSTSAVPTKGGPGHRADHGRSANLLPSLPFDGSVGGGEPARRRVLRSQGRRTMRKLLDAAMQAFDERGYHNARINDVVEIANTSRGTFYLYFSNKEDLLRALVAEAGAEATDLYSDLVTRRMDGVDWDDIRVWIGRYSGLWRRYAPLMRAWTDLAAIDPELGAQMRKTVEMMSRAMAARVEANNPRLDVDRQAAGVAILAMIDRFHYLREFTGDPVDDAALDTLTTIVHRALFDTSRPIREAPSP